MTNRSRRRRNAPNRTNLWIGLAVFAVILVVVGVVMTLSRNTSTNDNIQTISRDTLTAQHVEETQRVTYSTNPPVGGDHWARSATWGSYPTNPPPDEQLVHNMEHGGVIIWFNPEIIKGADYDALFAIYQSLSKINFRTLLVARTGMEKPVAVTAWGALLALDTVDQPQIESFYKAYILQGPECRNGQCPQ